MIFLQIQKPKTKNQKPKQCAKSFEVKASGMKEE
jgi:hypothetical protein